MPLAVSSVTNTSRKTLIMPIMKISPLNFDRIKKQNNSSMQASPIKPALGNDTVSFKSYGYVDDGLKVVDEIINSDIAPFMEDSKELYYKVGKIGFTSQKSLDSYKDNETGLMNYKFKLLDDTNNPLFPKAQKFLKIAKRYEDNLLAYENLTRLSELESYNTPQIKKELKELKTLVYAQNGGLKSITRFASAYEDNDDSLRSLFDNITLKDSYPAIHKRMQNTQTRHSIALAFMIGTPYGEAARLLKEKTAVKEDIQKTPKDIFLILKRVDKLQQEAQKIAESTKMYYENKEKMIKFAELAKHFELLTPTPDDLRTVYLKMNSSCGELAKNNRKKFEKEFSNEFEPNLNQIDMENVEELLNKQSAKADKIQSIINDIKQEMIDKNNKEFMKKYGLQDEDLA